MADQRSEAAPTATAGSSPDDVAPQGGADRAVRSLGWREVLIVAAAIVGIVLGLAVGTSFLPANAQGVIFRTPLLIVVLIVGTAAVLVRLVRRPPEG